MSRTYRRHKIAFCATSYMTTLKEAEYRASLRYFSKTPPQAIVRRNFRFFTDSWKFNSPRLFRNFIHRSERRRVKSQIVRAFRNQLEDELVDYRAKLPDWD